MAEKMKSAEAAAPLIDNGDVKKLLSATGQRSFPS